MLTFSAPDIIVKREVKHRAYDKAIQVLRKTHAEYGWSWDF